MPEIRYQSVGDIFPSFLRVGGLARARCLRSGNRSASVAARKQMPVIRMGEHDINLVNPGEKWQDAKVYRVFLSEDLKERWSKQPSGYLVVAMHDGSIRGYLGYRYRNIAKRQMGLAKSACTAVISKLAKRAPKDSGLGKRAEFTARKNVSITGRSSDKLYVLSIEDNISYSELAVKGGKAGVDLALKKAANKISANIRKKFGSFLKPGEITTPFPEVRRRRAS